MQLMKKKCTQLGKRIKSLRELTKLSQTEYAVKVEVNRTASISDYENGKREPELATLCKIAEFSNVSLDWLLAGKGRPKPPERATPSQAAQNQADPVEEALVKMFRGLSPKDRGDLIGKAEELKIKDLRKKDPAAQA